MSKTFLRAVALAITLAFPLAALRAQTGASGPTAAAIELANLSEQVRALNEQIGRLEQRLDAAEKENATLRTRLTAVPQAATASAAQLNAAIADFRALVQSTDQATRQDIAKQLKALADATNAALDSLAKGQVMRPPVTPSFTEDYPKDAILRYTVQKGDSLDVIAKKTGAKRQDIINANKLASPYTIQLGQTLQIPGGKPPAP
ncbi:MAG: LysM peptidoglycan-binding domain-containing protein [Verrucomicrobiota bacterium]